MRPEYETTVDWRTDRCSQGPLSQNTYPQVGGSNSVRIRKQLRLTNRERRGDHLVVRELSPLHDKDGEVSGGDDIRVHGAADVSRTGEGGGVVNDADPSR